MVDILRFEDVKEIQKLSGLGLLDPIEKDAVTCLSDFINDSDCVFCSLVEPRKVGKTVLLSQLKRKYENSVYVDFKQLVLKRKL